MHATRGGVATIVDLLASETMSEGDKSSPGSSSDMSAFEFLEPNTPDVIDFPEKEDDIPALTVDPEEEEEVSEASYAEVETPQNEGAEDEPEKDTRQLSLEEVSKQMHEKLISERDAPKTLYGETRDTPKVDSELAKKVTVRVTVRKSTPKGKCKPEEPLELPQPFDVDFLWAKLLPQPVFKTIYYENPIVSGVKIAVLTLSVFLLTTDLGISYVWLASYLANRTLFIALVVSIVSYGYQRYIKKVEDPSNLISGYIGDSCATCCCGCASLTANLPSRQQIVDCVDDCLRAMPKMCERAHDLLCCKNWSATAHAIFWLYVVQKIMGCFSLLSLLWIVRHANQ